MLKSTNLEVVNDFAIIKGINLFDSLQDFFKEIANVYEYLSDEEGYYLNEEKFMEAPDERFQEMIKYKIIPYFRKSEEEGKLILEENFVFIKDMNMKFMKGTVFDFDKNVVESLNYSTMVNLIDADEVKQINNTPYYEKYAEDEVKKIFKYIKENLKDVNIKEIEKNFFKYKEIDKDSYSNCLWNQMKYIEVKFDLTKVNLFFENHLYFKEIQLDKINRGDIRPFKSGFEVVDIIVKNLDFNTGFWLTDAICLEDKGEDSDLNIESENKFPKLSSAPSNLKFEDEARVIRINKLAKENKEFIKDYIWVD